MPEGAVAGRNRVNRNPEDLAGRFVQDQVLALIAVNAGGRGTGHRRDVVGEQTGAVDDPAGRNRPGRRGENESIRTGLDRGHLRPNQTSAPLRKALSARAIVNSYGEMMPVQGEYKAHLPRASGAIAPNGGFVHDLEARRAVFPAPSRSSSRCRPSRIVRRDDELSGFPVGNMKGRRQVVDGLEGGGVQPGFQRAGPNVEAGVDDAAVALADAFGQVGVFFQEDELEAVARKLPQYGAADDASADDGDIIRSGRFVSLIETRNHTKSLKAAPRPPPGVAPPLTSRAFSGKV